MSTRRYGMALVAGIAMAGFTAGCGSDDGDDKPPTIAEAKAKISKDCQNGKAADKPLCDCVADKLQEKGQTAQQILDLNDKVNDNKVPAIIRTVIADCAKEAAAAG